MTRAHRCLLGLAATVAVIATACGNADDSPDDETTASPVASSDASAAAVEPDDAGEPAQSGVEPDEDIEPAQSDGGSDPAAAQPGAEAPFVDDAPVLWLRFNPFEPGTYRVDSLGTPMSFTSTGPLSVQPNGNGFVAISTVDSEGPGDRELLFMRVSKLSDPTRTGEDLADQEGWPANDLGGWLSALPAEIPAGAPVETMVGGRPAIAVDINLSDVPIGDLTCSPIPGVCLEFATNNLRDFKTLEPGSSHRLWMVDMDTEDPLLVAMTTTDAADSAWFDTADQLLGTVAFGTVKPNPVRTEQAGTISLDALGPITVEIESERMVLERTADHGIIQAPSPDFIEFARNPVDLDGTSIETSDALIAELEGAGVSVANATAVVVDGFEGLRIDVEGVGVEGPVFKFNQDPLEAEQFGWYGPERGRVWLIEHPDRGLLTISALAYGGGPSATELVFAEGQQIVESLVFTDG